jgi:RHS repeat-associated protein
MYNSAGERVWQAEHSLWGTLALQWGKRPSQEPDVTCNLRFQGQWWDEETGLHYNRHRCYDPGTAQYLTPDPIGLDGGIREYAYVHNPMGWVDPLGLAACASARDTITRGPNREILTVKGTIKPEDIGTGTDTNASSRAWARALGNETDDAGHTRAANLGGSGGKDYVWPQNPSVNRGDFRVFVGDIADHVLSTGQPVDFEQTFNYGNGGTRPTSVDYNVFDLDGNTLSQQRFNNP